MLSCPVRGGWEPTYVGKNHYISSLTENVGNDKGRTWERSSEAPASNKRIRAESSLSYVQ